MKILKPFSAIIEHAKPCNALKMPQIILHNTKLDRSNILIYVHRQQIQLYKITSHYIMQLANKSSLYNLVTKCRSYYANPPTTFHRNASHNYIDLLKGEKIDQKNSATLKLPNYWTP